MPDSIGACVLSGEILLQEKRERCQTAVKVYRPLPDFESFAIQVYEVERGGRKTFPHEGRIKAYYAGKKPRRRTAREDTPRKEEATPDPAPAHRPDILSSYVRANVFII